MPSNTDRWTWYGLLVLFALPPMCLVLSRLSLRGFAMSMGGDPVTPLTAIAFFLLTTLAGWAGVLFGLALAVALWFDSRRLVGTDCDWRPTPLYALAGVVHAAGTMLFVPFVVSVPAVGYYLVRRRRVLSAG
ncbi:hypothetical protein [Haloarcula pellucida]|uniref:Uncharacterized protein n=1 Tax=Haloarcula pellucida TaxID=1427151 RepID=A0A830GS30_9EURY|nr:hypothetical protein [Halomicroarcula pellucida]MBX0349619.1 hypothetical protein [Halomicroarcula pellucida]GGO02041.1 hypothetical protein GCM10009030_36240 [Halomicroarcula pellucida]